MQRRTNAKLRGPRALSVFVSRRRQATSLEDVHGAKGKTVTMSDTAAFFANKKKKKKAKAFKFNANLVDASTVVSSTVHV
jgi:hypothetical protein